ncbi:unnamed protein product, partial [Prorocentrum cordatum]
SVPPATQTRYRGACEKFKGFACEHGLSILAGAAVDSSLEVYLDHVWFDGRSIFDAGRCAWGGVSRDPMPQQALFLACDWLCDMGNKANLSASQVYQTTANDIKVAPSSLRGAGYPAAAIMIAQSSEGDDGGASRRPITMAVEQDDTVVFTGAASKEVGGDQVAGLLAKLKAAKRGSSAPLFGLTVAEYERRCMAAFEACSLGALCLAPRV